MDIHIIIEKGDSGYWGENLSKARKNMKDAINGHLDIANEYNHDVLNHLVVETLHI